MILSCQEQHIKPSKIVHAGLSKIKANTINSLDKNYWYGGKAEVSKYKLNQNRYREVHDGEIILIFVTEDFLTDKQVKNDNYTNSNSISVLKTNQLRSLQQDFMTTP